MPFGIDFGDIFDFATDFIPGGDFIDEWAGINQPAPPSRQLPGGNGQVAMIRDVRNSQGNGFQTGCAVTMPLTAQTRYVAPAGYVVVTDPRTGQKVGMLKEVARACKLWKPRPKPVLTAADKKALNKAERVARKVDTVVKQTNSILGKSKWTKMSRKRS